MFGYIKPDHKELKVKEHELYKATYCGLCRVMGKRYSYIYKMSLSYDFVFMVLLRLFISKQDVSFSNRRCIAHPTKKKLMMDENEALQTAADVGVIMLYHDFRDKINDKDNNKHILYRLLMPELKRLRKKACKNIDISEFDKIVENHISKLSSYEKNNTDSVDIPANEFGCILGEALSIGYSENTKRIAMQIGKNLGKWIYITDAVDDIDKDEKTKSYNPFLAIYKTAENAKKHGNTINTALLNELNTAYNSLILLDNTDKGIFNILDNIIRLGNINTQENIMKNKGFALESKENT